MENQYSPFNRHVSSAMLDRLMREPLYINYLRPDIAPASGVRVARNQSVFLAIRNRRIDFYHRGGKLFSFDNAGFETNLKYAATIIHHNKKTTVRESELRDVRCITDFSSGYASIKSLCALYAHEEARGVSELYSRFPYTAHGQPVVVLDIEASFDSRLRDDSDNTQDRIDLILLNTRSKELLFVEAKRQENPEIHASDANVPPVVSQIGRYRDQIEVQKKPILESYGRVVEATNALLGLDLPRPESIVPEVPLLVFGYDRAQENGPVKACKQRLISAKVCCLGIGQPRAVKAATLESWFHKARSQR